MAAREVVLFHEPGADEAIQRFIFWAGIASAALDLGVGADGHHRYSVDPALWLAYVREKSGR